MNSFSQFAIEPENKGFDGDKIRIEKIFNREIVVEAFRVVDSNFEKGSGKCLHLQIIVDNTKRVVFTGSINLIDMIKKVPPTGFPFKTIIVKENDRFQFT